MTPSKETHKPNDQTLPIISETIERLHTFLDTNHFQVLITDLAAYTRENANKFPFVHNAWRESRVLEANDIFYMCTELDSAGLANNPKIEALKLGIFDQLDTGEQVVRRNTRAMFSHQDYPGQHFTVENIQFYQPNNTPYRTIWRIAVSNTPFAISATMLEIEEDTVLIDYQDRKRLQARLLATLPMIKPKVMFESIAVEGVQAEQAIKYLSKRRGQRFN